jgi:hypothetical protein
VVATSISITISTETILTAQVIAQGTDLAVLAGLVDLGELVGLASLADLVGLVDPGELVGLASLAGLVDPGELADLASLADLAGSVDPGAQAELADRAGPADLAGAADLAELEDLANLSGSTDQSTEGMLPTQIKGRPTDLAVGRNNSPHAELLIGPLPELELVDPEEVKSPLARRVELRLALVAELAPGHPRAQLPVVAGTA